MAKVRLVSPPTRPGIVRIAYRNPAIRTRSGKTAPGSVVFRVDGKEFEIYTVYGAAKILGRSAPRVQQLLESEKLRGYRIGRDWVILDNDLRSFITAEGAKLRKRHAAFLDNQISPTRGQNR